MELGFDWLSPLIVNELFIAISTHVLLAGSGGGVCLESSWRKKENGKKQMDLKKKK